MKGKIESKIIELIKTDIFSFADLEADMKANMKAVGEIIFWCYTKRPKYNNECYYYPLLKQAPEYMKKINTDVVDLLNKLLRGGATAMDVATYYIFWTEEKTLDFIRAVTERLDSKDFTKRGTLEHAKELQEMFDKKKGFCSFLMKLFPNLIREAYHPLKDYLHQDHRFTKFYKQFNPECD